MATFPGIFRVPHIHGVDEEYVEEWPSSLQTKKIILRDYVIKRNGDSLRRVSMRCVQITAAFG